MRRADAGKNCRRTWRKSGPRGWRSRLRLKNGPDSPGVGMAHLRIVLPFPPAQLFPNRANGRAWQGLRALKDEARDTAYMLTKQASKRFSAPAGDIPITLTFHAPDRRKRDRDNCLSASKHMLDGVALALGIDDARFEPLIVRRGEISPPGALVVEIWLDGGA